MTGWFIAAPIILTIITCFIAYKVTWGDEEALVAAGIISVFVYFGISYAFWESCTPEGQTFSEEMRQHRAAKMAERNFEYIALDGSTGVARDCKILGSKGSAGAALGVGGASYEAKYGYACWNIDEDKDAFPVKSYKPIDYRRSDDDSAN